MGKTIGLDVDIEDIKDHHTELRIEMIVQIQNEQQNFGWINVFWGEERKGGCLKFFNKRKLLLNVQSFVEKYHPDTLVANGAVNLFNDNVVSHFRKVLQRREKQLTLAKYLKEEKKKRNPREKIYLSQRSREGKKHPKDSCQMF